MASAQSSVTGRFAPSPTGRLHLGNARTALLAWLWTRSQGGRFLLRIEDLDRSRCRPEHTDTLLRDLEYLGLDWDGEVLFQSQRADVYQAALDSLAVQGLLYRCFCTRAEVARSASAPHGPADDGPRYPGICSRLTEQQADARAKERSHALRFRVSPGAVFFEDALQGKLSQDVSATVGDFIVRGKDLVASYQLAVVVDDAACGVTDVVRGLDLVDSTPRQLLLHRALTLPEPRYAHVPLVLGPDHKRLAKREGPLAISDLRLSGVPSERVVGLLASWCNLASAPVRARELVSVFSPESIPNEPVVTSEADVRRTLAL